MKRAARVVLWCAVLFFALQQAQVHAGFLWDALNWDGTDNVLKVGGGDVKAIYGGIYRWTGGNWHEETRKLDELTEDHAVVAIFKATALNGVSDESGDGEITGYLALKVAQVTHTGYKFTAPASPGWDPFGKLAANEALQVWFDTAENFTYADADGRGDDVHSAVWGNLFGGFGFVGTSAVEAWATETSLTIYGGLNLTQNPGGFPFVKRQSPLPPHPWVDLSIHAFGLGTTPQGNWTLSGNDELKFRLTPEPGTVTALLAMGGAAGLGLALRRRKGA